LTLAGWAGRKKTIISRRWTPIFADKKTPRPCCGDNVVGITP
jgi:hypothetical protein